MPRGGTRDGFSIDQRREKVSIMYLQGKSQWAISLVLDVTRQTITNDIQAMRVMWRDSALMNLDERQHQELAKIDRIEAVAWEEYERSKGVIKTRTKSRTRGTDTNETKKTLKTEERLGDPKYLDIAMKCIADRCKLLMIGDITKPPPEKSKSRINPDRLTPEKQRLLDELLTEATEPE